MNWDLNVVAPLDEYRQYISAKALFMSAVAIHAVTGSSIILDYEDDFFKGIKDKYNQDVGLAEPKRDYIDLTLFNYTDLLQ